MRPILLACLVLPGFSFDQQKTNSAEYQLKAVFLYNFTQFVTWPTETFGTEQTPFVIGVIGKNPFGNYLDEVVAGESVNGRPLKVVYYKTAGEIKDCQILFIDKTEASNQQGILTELKGKRILTVSDIPNFMEQGGMIRFFTRNNKIQLQVNLDAVRAAQLDVSSKLLRLSEIFVAK